MSEISSSDIEEKFTQLKDQIESAAGAARGTLTKAGVVAGIVLLIMAFVIGSRRGRAAKTIVEVRRL